MAAITTYLDVISLDQAQNRLRIEDDLAGLTEELADITEMVKAALAYMERETNILVYPRAAKLYDLDANNQVRVYDFPITAVNGGLVEDTDYKVEVKAGYSLYTVYDTTTIESGTLSLSVGYDDTDNVPTNFVQAAKMLLEQYYYDSQTPGARKEAIPPMVRTIINELRRFHM